MELFFHKATKEDAGVVFQLCRDLIDTYEDCASIDYPKVLQWVEKKISGNIHNYTVVTLCGEKVGYYCLEKQEDKWELNDFYILPQYRNQGIGTTVLKQICEMVCGPIYLYVFRKNIGAISLYKRFGFDAVAVVSDTRQLMERPG